MLKAEIQKKSSLYKNFFLYIFQNVTGASGLFSSIRITYPGCGLAWDREEKTTLRGKPKKGWNQHIFFKNVFFHLIFNVIILWLLRLISIIIIIIIMNVRVLSLDGTTRNKLMFNCMQMTRVFTLFHDHTPNKRLYFLWKPIRKTLSKVKYLLSFFSDCLQLFFFLACFVSLCFTFSLH